MAIRVHSSGSLPAGQILVDSTEVTGNYTFAILFDQFNSNPSSTFANAGLISVSTGRTGVLDLGTPFGINLFWNQTSGVLRMADPLTGSFQIIAYLGAGDVTNDGVILVQGGTAYGILEQAPFARHVFNTGTIIVNGAWASYGVDLHNGGYFTNTGDIEAYSLGSAVGVIYQNTTISGNFINSGVIRAHSDSNSPYASIAVYDFDPTTSAVSTFVNSGLIAGDYAFRSASGEGLFTPQMTKEVIQNSGEMDGVVFMGYGDDTVTNTGVINGLIDLFQGNDTYSGAGERSAAFVDGGQGNDKLDGGSFDDFLLGSDGADTISAGGGDDYVEGGRGADTLDGGAGFDTLSYFDATRAVTVNLAAGTADSDAHDLVSNFEDVIGSRFGDSITGSDSADALEGFAGNDVLVGGIGDDVLFGDTGQDTLTGGAGNDTFVFSAGDGADIITDFVTGGLDDSITVYGYAASQSRTQQGADTLVTFSSNDSILLKNVLASSLTSADFQFLPGQSAAAPAWTGLQTIQIQASYTIAAGEVLSFLDPDPLYAMNTVWEASGVVVDNWAGELVLTNGGVISVEAAPNTGYVSGVDWAGNGKGGTYTLINQVGAVIRAVSDNEAEAIGATEGSITNAGRVEANSFLGSATGLITGSGVANNTGTISVSAGTSGAGISVRNATVFFNTGQIVVDGGIASVGVSLEAGGVAPPSATNSGSIIVTDHTAALDSVGIRFTFGFTGATVSNSGTITADYALRQADARFSNEGNLIENFVNTGTLNGLVSLGVGSGRLTNSGLITGRIDLGLDNDIYDGRLGTELGGVFGGAGADILLGGVGADVLDGGQANDILAGGKGADNLTGGTGNDSFRFAVGDGADTITDFVAGGTDDTIIVEGYAGFQSAVQQGADTLVTFSASDTILLKNVTASALTGSDFQFSAAPLSNPLPTLSPAPFTPTIIGTSGGDTLTGTAEADYITGLDGSDTLDGGGNADILDGGAGDDLLIARPGDTLYLGDFGYDTISFALVSTGVAVDLRNAGVLETGIGRASFGGIEAAIGTAYDDVFYAGSGFSTDVGANLDGGSGNDTLYGGNWFDTLIGGEGDDHLYGGDRADVLLGGAGNDWLQGDSGNNTYTGGAGADIFATIFGSSDIVNDFDPTVDKLRLINWANYISLDASGPDTILRLLSGSVTLRNVTPDQLTIAGNFIFNVLTDIAQPGSAVGSSGPDELTRTTSDDLIIGLGGNDQLSGGAGANTMDGGAGADALFGGGGADIFLLGGDGQDIIHGGDGDDVFIANTHWTGIDNLYGDAGDDVITLAGPVIALEGGAGVDTLEIGPNGGVLSAFSAANGFEFFGDRSHTGITGTAAANTLDFSSMVPLWATSTLTVFARDGDDVVTGLSGGGRNVLNGENGNDALIGGTANDSLSGGSGRDFLVGGGGADTIDGGAGRDLSVYATSAGAAVFTHNSNGSWTISAGSDGIDTVSGVELARFSDRDISLSTQGTSTNDFNVDGGSDVLFRNDSGELYVWNSQGVGAGAFLGQSLGAIDNSWHVQATGDYNGDGQADVLWRNADGRVYVYNSDVGAAVGFLGQGLGTTDNVWRIQPAAGDFNGDGRDDVLWRHDNGEIYLWESSGVGQQADAFDGHTLGLVGNDWTVQGLGDFNGDVRSDILWRNTSGDVYVSQSQLNGGQVVLVGQSISSVSLDWTIQGVGDFNGDGRSDILWRNVSGEVYVWNSNTGSDISFVGQSLGFVGNDWTIADIADLNGDGRSDVLWRRDNGDVYAWNSHATGPAAFDGQGLGNTPNAWHIISDFHGV